MPTSKINARKAILNPAFSGKLQPNKEIMDQVELIDGILEQVLHKYYEESGLEFAFCKLATEAHGGGVQSKKVINKIVKSIF